MSRNINLLEGPILSSLWRFAAPFMLTAFVQMAYGLTDMMWIGRIDTDAVTAVGIVGLLTWFGDSVSMIARTGLGVLVSQSYGEDNPSKVRSGLINGFYLALLIGGLYALASTLFLDGFMGFYNLGTKVNDYAFRYGYIVLPAMFFKMVNVSFTQAYQSLGNSLTPFRINVLGLIINMVFDPLLIFGLGPIAPMGITGAAIATAFSQFMVFIIFIISFRKDSILSRIKLWEKPDLSIWKDIFKIGFPIAMLNGAHCIVSTLLNRIIGDFGSTEVAVTSIGSQIESISWMTAEGFAGAVTAMVAQNYGAKRQERVKKTISYGMLSCLAIGVLALFILIVFRYPLFELFLPGDTRVIRLGASYLLIFGISQPFMTIETGGTACFNGLGQTRIPSLISISLNVLRIPASLFLLGPLGVQGVWLAMSLSSVLKGLINNISLGLYLNKKRIFQVS